MVAAIWREYGFKAWKAETVKFSTDPEVVAKVTDIVGLYLAPPDHAVVLCCDEESQIQALNRTQQTQPMQPGRGDQRTDGYVRHGATTLFAAFETATGKVAGTCQQRHRHQEFLAFLKHSTTPSDRQPAGQGTTAVGYAVTYSAGFGIASTAAVTRPLCP
jgi:hypothetical protein